MGIYDREYYRDERPGPGLRMPQSAVGLIVLVNAAVYIFGELTGNTARLSDIFGAHAATLWKPWMWWQFVTYGFVHSSDPWHVLGNMLVLFFFGRELEARYGRNEFLRLYFVLIVAGSVVWAILNQRGDIRQDSVVIGASGAVSGMVVLYAINYPHHIVLLFFVLPTPAWVLGVLVVAGDMYGALHRPELGQVAYSVHLVGAALAGLYAMFEWNFGRLLDPLTRFRRGSRPRWNVVRPQEEESQPNAPSDEMAEQVDRILEKISKQGEASLTPRERATLENASREYQRRRGDKLS